MYVVVCTHDRITITLVVANSRSASSRRPRAVVFTEGVMKSERKGPRTNRNRVVVMPFSHRRNTTVTGGGIGLWHFLFSGVVEVAQSTVLGYVVDLNSCRVQRKLR